MRFIKRFFRFVFYSCLVLGLLGAIAGLGVGVFYYMRLTRDLPRISRVNDYKPKAVTEIYSADGTLMAEVFEQRRYPVPFEEIPQVVRDAFLAAEDANFYQHPGIDVISILRAIWVNLQHKEVKQGASTITQQMVKSLLLSRERTYERKAKEAILSYRLEKALTKDEIFSIYLNEIYLGSTSYGVKAAARIHFHKELDELNIAEAAYLAALPQKPSYLANPKHREAAFRRQRYVIDQMVKNRMIGAPEAEEAKKFPIEIFPPSRRTIYAAPYYASHVLKILDEKLQSSGGYATAMAPGGFKVHTALNLEANAAAQKAVRSGLRKVDKRRGWRGPLAKVEQGELNDLLDAGARASRGGLRVGKVYRALVTKRNRKTGRVVVQVGDYAGLVDLTKATWARKMLDDKDRVQWSKPLREIQVGHIIEVSLDEKKTKDPSSIDPKKPVWFKLDQTPKIEGALVLANALTGEVQSIVGGYDYTRSQFNRATQGLRQPGSAFKPFIYLAAIDELNFTPATIVPDSPISMVDGTGEVWSPQNFDEKFIGPITLRTALQRSRNVVSVYLLTKLGVETGINYARKLGITTPIGREMSISLGAAEVKLIELVRAYGVFAAGGWLAEPIVIRSIEDRDGEVVYQARPKQEKVISEESAFIMANMMKGVVERGTARVVSQLKRPVAGKTGTTNEQMDAWFIGYTPEWVAGVWVGFDVKRTIGDKETGGRAAAPIFLSFMQEFLKDEPDLDFNIPNGVIPVRVNPSTGRLATKGDPNTFVEYFKTGTEPRFTAADQALPQEYLESDEF